MEGSNQEGCNWSETIINFCHSPFSSPKKIKHPVHAEMFSALYPAPFLPLPGACVPGAYTSFVQFDSTHQGRPLPFALFFVNLLI